MNKKIELSYSIYRVTTAYIEPYMAELDIVKLMLQSIVAVGYMLDENDIKNKEEIDKSNLEICELISEHNNLIENIVRSIEITPHRFYYIVESKLKHFKKQINNFPVIIKNKVISLFDLILANNISCKETIENAKEIICQTIDTNIMSIVAYISDALECCEYEKV